MGPAGVGLNGEHHGGVEAVAQHFVQFVGQVHVLVQQADQRPVRDREQRFRARAPALVLLGQGDDVPRAVVDPRAQRSGFGGQPRSAEGGPLQHQGVGLRAHSPGGRVGLGELQLTHGGWVKNGGDAAAGGWSGTGRGRSAVAPATAIRKGAGCPRQNVSASPAK